MNPRNIPTIRIPKSAGTGLLITGLLMVASLHADTTWNGATSDQWTEAGNWSNGLPTSSQDTFIQTGTIYLNGTGAARSLNFATTASASATLFIGANLTVSSAQQSLIGTGSGATGTVTQTAGSASFANALTLGGNGGSAGGTASYTISGGSLTVSGSNGLRMGFNTAGSSTSLFTQSGGAVTLTKLTLGAARYTGSTGTPTNTTGYTISGGTLTMSGDFTHGLSTFGGTGRINATTQIVGSTGTISVGGNLTLNNNTRNFSTLSYAIDNGGVSKINLTGTGTATLAGTLQSGFKGGMALTTTDHFTLIEADTGKISGSFGTSPNATLWSVATSAVSGTRDAVVLSLAGSAEKAALTTSVQSATFAASTTGYATLANLTIGENVGLYIAADAGTGKTLTELVTYFTNNGIAATALESGPYSLLVTQQALAGTSWFAWDLSGFNADATFSGIAVAIPEPSTWSVLLGSGGLLLAAVRRRKH